MDGGTVELKCEDQFGIKFSIEITQRVFTANTDFDSFKKTKLPGRIYLNGKCVIPRSELEVRILNCLRKIKYPKSETLELDKQIIEEDIEFIQSENYLKLYKKTEAWK